MWCKISSINCKSSMINAFKRNLYTSTSNISNGKPRKRRKLHIWSRKPIKDSCSRKFETHPDVCFMSSGNKMSQNFHDSSYFFLYRERISFERTFRRNYVDQLQMQEIQGHPKEYPKLPNTWWGVYLDPTNIPKTPSQELFGRLGITEHIHLGVVVWFVIFESSPIYLHISSYLGKICTPFWWKNLF